MKVHLDGARIANAAAALDVPMRAFTYAAGVDVLSFGGTKNGMLFGEAVVVLDPDAVRAMKHLRKLSMQLASKMRFVSAQLEALLAKDLWLRNARHANAMARRLAAGVRAVEGVDDPLPGAGQRGLRAAPARRERAAAEALPLLLLGRGRRRRALDVRLRHHSRRRRRIRRRPRGGDGPGLMAERRLGAEALRVAALGERATLVHFSTAFCQPCRATRRVLGEVAAMLPGVEHVEIDAESRLDLVRELGVTATPTVLVLDAGGCVRRMAAGLPRKADIIAALGSALA